MVDYNFGLVFKRLSNAVMITDSAQFFRTMDHLLASWFHHNKNGQMSKWRLGSVISVTPARLGFSAGLSTLTKRVPRILGSALNMP